MNLPGSWLLSGEMYKHSSRIHKDNTLSKEQKAAILKKEPRNSNIKYSLPTIGKRMWKLLSPQSRELDKFMTKILYRTSAVLRSLDNILRALYQSTVTIWHCKWQQVLKTISPNYQNLLDINKVFGEDLKDLVERESATNKFINEAFRNKAHASNRSNTSNFKRPTTFYSIYNKNNIS
ncbi:4550_t:CDS:2 [Dentiscutata heterogama]|uniref:4550_t:CDS:1 n=1 Tax=Dentiscutata heterogama TaxID=1316150 RepID=A0ACA9JXX9_9GLOM|nr:4550_t:CDS:2 [Dentiscutata heterogama]